MATINMFKPRDEVYILSTKQTGVVKYSLSNYIYVELYENGKINYFRANDLELKNKKTKDKEINFSVGDVVKFRPEILLHVQSFNPEDSFLVTKTTFTTSKFIKNSNLYLCLDNNHTSSYPSDWFYIIEGNSTKVIAYETLDAICNGIAVVYDLDVIDVGNQLRLNLLGLSTLFWTQFISEKGYGEKYPEKITIDYIIEKCSKYTTEYYRYCSFLNDFTKQYKTFNWKEGLQIESS